MYPAAELSDLAARKARLRRDIAVSRLHCITRAGEVARPIAMLDRIRTQWAKIAPYAKFAAVPLGILLQKKATTRRPAAGIFGQALKWMPAVLSAARILRGRRP